MITAVLSNEKHPEYGVITIPFPIHNYTETYEILETIGAGHIAIRDCFVKELDSDIAVLKRLRETEINVDELDYLAKRLESFDRYELAQFQGAAVCRDLSNMTDLINLTFCCQSVTVVQDFTDLEAIGRTHHMNLHGGLTIDELQKIDFHKTALALLLDEDGLITPYGVVCENGMELAQVYDGLYFPDYRYSGDTLLVVAVTDWSLPEDSKDITWLYLPAEDCQIERALLRSGANRMGEMRLRITGSELPEEVDATLGMENDDLLSLNRLCQAVSVLGMAERQKLAAVTQFTNPCNAKQITHLAEQLNLFDYVPDISTPEEYGRYMIQKSGHYEYDDNLGDFYDFKGYGEQRIADEHGQFVPNGYISYHGFISIEEVLSGNQTKRMDMTMGGM